MSLHFGKWLSVFGSYVKLALFTVFVILAIVYFAGGHSTGQPLSLADLVPTNNWGLIVSGILPVLIFSWVGFELKYGAGEEMHDPQRDVPPSLIRSRTLAVIPVSFPIT